MSKARRLLTGDYASLLAEVKERVRAAQYAALKEVNKELVALYWDIGRLIASRQADAAHGAAIAEQLAADLRQEYPGVNGYSRRNVFYMREFYLAYRASPKVQPLVAQIGWTQNLIILQHCKDPLEREFYIRMTKKSAGPSGTNTPSTSSNSAKHTVSSNLNARSSPASSSFCGPWEACSPSWAVSFGWRWTEKSSSSICCCSTAA